MQCVNCGFQNMPGSDVCGRCSTSLGLATAVMDVHPPRAGAWAKRTRRVLPVRRAFYRVRDAVPEAAIPRQLSNWKIPTLPSGMLLRCVVPGWAHARLGQPLRGRLFFAGFLVCLVPAMWLLGSTWGSIWLGLAFSVHSSAVLDVVMQTFDKTDLRGQIGRAIAVSAIVWVVLYMPAMWIIGGVAEAHVVATDIGAFRAGDVLRVNTWIAPRSGELVMYSINEQPLPGMTEDHRRVVAYAGESVERILAGPGDHVQSRAGQLFVNGLPSAWKPFNPGPIPDGLNLTVSPGHYLIAPNGIPSPQTTGSPGPWLTAADVPRESIAGRVYLQTLPLSRCRLLH